MGGIMWALRWVAAGTILANCILLPIDAALDAAAFADTQSAPLIVQDEVRSERS